MLPRADLVIWSLNIAWKLSQIEDNENWTEA